MISKESLSSPLSPLQMTRPAGTYGLQLKRLFTREGRSPYDDVEWEFRTASIKSEKGEVIFEQKNVEVPKSWSQSATNIAASKYFHGKLGTAKRESSVRGLIERVVKTITEWGLKGGYFKGDADLFHDELSYILLHQMAAFNSPVWFNVGIETRAQASACFINSVEDTMESILTLAKTEGMLFKYGSGTGSNLSTLRSSKERLSTGGIASGPVSFMKGYDAFAGVIKCLSAETYIYTASGLRQIRDLISEDLDVGFHHNDSIVLATKDGPKRTSHVYVSPESDVYKITLASTGLELKGTIEHPVLTLDENLNLAWKRLGDLSPGDSVAVARNINVWPEEAPSFEEFDPGLTSANVHVTYPDRMTKFLARLLGYLVSEGCLDEERVRFVNADIDVMDDFLCCIKEVFGRDASSYIRERKDPSTGVITLQLCLNWKGVVKFLRHLGLDPVRSHNKVVPSIILRSPKEYVIEFLRAYFEGDGHISHFVFASSASKQLLQQIQLLLLNLGIISALKPHRVNDSNYYMLSMRGEQAHVFLQKVGFVSTRRERNIRLPETVNTNIDVVPGVVSAIRQYGKGKNGYYACSDGKTRMLNVGFFNRSGNNVSYNKLESTVALVESAELINEGLGYNLDQLLRYRFFWDKVAEKQYIGKHKTFDFTVPETHSFIANGIVNHNSGGRTRRAAKMVILNIDHPDIVEFITSKEKEEKKAWALIDAGYDGSLTGEAYSSIFFQNANHSIRVTDEFMRAVLEDKEWTTKAVTTGEVMDRYRARDLLRMIAQSAYVCGDPGMQYDTTTNRWHTCKNTDRIYASNPCGEYVFLNDTACNLASLNLMKFVREDGRFDVEAFRHACEIVITAQEIIVGNASYPTEKIAKNSYEYRPLGLGYANLGALLMYNGVPYDSDRGRDIAAAITAVMTGQAYLTSAKIASEVGPFQGFEKNREPMLDVIATHRDSVDRINPANVPADLYRAARETWDGALELGKRHGYRNAQATVIAPTGTISLMMDCDTTGIEPDLALVKYKKLVGGGIMKIVNNTVPEALKKLGYDKDQIADIVKYIDENGTIEGAPQLKPEHLPVFDCAFKPANGARSIHYMGHVKMMAVTQPFISGAISKTVNMPEETTVEEIEQTYIEAWKLGLKAIAIYRDGSKRTQPLNVAVKEKKVQAPEAAFKPVRKKLPNERKAITHKFNVGGHEGYITVGMFDDGAPGEIFLVMAKEGSTISGLMDSFATAISLALQYGVPLKALADKFAHTRFEPSGYTGNPEIPYAKSVMDYIFRWLALKFLPRDGNGSASVAPLEPSQRSLGESNGESLDATLSAQADAPICANCGSIMVRNGACYKCLNCGETSGCS